MGGIKMPTCCIGRSDMNEVLLSDVEVPEVDELLLLLLLPRGATFSNHH